MPGTLDVETVLALVRQRGGRITAARRAVIEALLAGEGQHLTADDLAARVQADHPEVHLSTVYRTLDALEDLGVTTHVHLGHGPSSYHLAGETHHHAVCSRCGAVVELPADLFDEIAHRVSRASGFRVNAEHFALSGLCSACQRAGMESAPPT